MLQMYMMQVKLILIVIIGHIFRNQHATMEMEIKILLVAGLAIILQEACAKHMTKQHQQMEIIYAQVWTARTMDRHIFTVKHGALTTAKVQIPI